MAIPRLTDSGAENSLACVARPAIFLSVLAIGLAGCGPAPDQGSRPSAILLVPRPRSMQILEGSFRLPARVTIAVGSGGGDDAFAASLLEDDLKRAGARKVVVRSGGGGPIVLSRTSDDRLGKEGYRLAVDRRGVRLTAPTAAGIYYGVQTLRQLIRAGSIPAVRIEDWPAMRWRGAHDDLSRGPLPTVDALERRIRTLAEFKTNLYVLYLEQSFAYAAHPLFAPRGGTLSAADVRELVAFARQHHVELVPEQQTFGHLHGILRYEKYYSLGELPYGEVLTPATPQTYEFIASLYRELVPLFPGPFLHIGGDEPRELGYGQSKPLADTLGLPQLYLAHLILTDRAISAPGKELLVWGDLLASHPGLVGRLPADMVPVAWSYDVRDSFDKATRPFLGSGRGFFVSPGASNWNRVFPELAIAIPNIHGLAREGQRAGAVGEITCTWGDGGESLFGENWYALAYGAAAGWEQGGADPDSFARSFDWAFFRHSGTDVADAIRLVSHAHDLLRGSIGKPAGLDVMWLEPFESDDREVLSRALPIARSLRAEQERAIELIENARTTGGRNGDQLDYIVFAARRLHYLGDKILDAWRVREAYDKARASSTTLEATQYLALISGVAEEGLGTCVQLRSEFERLWALENRPYSLGVVAARFERENAMWLEQERRFRALAHERQSRGNLPSPESIGLTKR